ncbi:MAG TPA: hypothetical protein VFZ08_05980, partial [Terriglobia bacterium]|nr:hypothetical protein [Terriglobia bacterium]
GAPGQQDSPERLLIDAGQLRALSRSAPGPFLLMVQNNEIDQALSVAGAMRPLWQSWKYSIWEKKP